MESITYAGYVFVYVFRLLILVSQNPLVTVVKDLNFGLDDDGTSKIQSYCR